MTRFAMVIDTRKCVGCMDCVVACQTENNTPEGLHRDWIRTTTEGTFPDLKHEIRSERCHHCHKTPCVAGCPTGASHVGFGGAVLVTPAKCTGCKACIASCPYNARYMHPRGYVDKCTFCAHRTPTGGLPACVSVCPTQCLTFGDLKDPSSEVNRLIRENRVKQINTYAGTKPQLYFIS